MERTRRLDSWLVSLLIATSLHYVGSSEGPQIVRISFNQTALPGDAVEFNCTVSGAEDSSVLWAKLDPKDGWSPTFITAAEKVIVSDPRISVKYDNESSSYALKLSKVQPEDDGVYSCQIIISPDQKVVSAKTKLTVRQ